MAGAADRSQPHSGGELELVLGVGSSGGHRRGPSGQADALQVGADGGKLVSGPNAERAATETVCTLSHQLLLSDRKSLAKVLDAVAKVKENIDELVGDGGRRKSARGGWGAR